MLNRRRDLDRSRPRRWILKKDKDKDRLMATVLAAIWSPREEPLEGRDAIIQEVEWLRDTMADICDVAMPRVRFLPRCAEN